MSIFRAMKNARHLHLVADIRYFGETTDEKEFLMIVYKPKMSERNIRLRVGSYVHVHGSPLINEQCYLRVERRGETNSKRLASYIVSM